MSKIIKNIEENIINSALELFSQKGYSDIEMKMIAQKAGIAVGTLYNYFPNKKQLFLTIFNKGWKEIFKKLDNVAKLNIDPIEKLQKYLLLLYDEVEKKKGLGNELIKNNVIQKKEKPSQFLRKLSIIINMKMILQQIRQKYGLKFDEQMDERMSEILLMTVFENIFHHPLEQEYNKKFIMRFVECLIGEDY